MKKGDLIIIVLGLIIAASSYAIYTWQHPASDQKMLLIKSEGNVVQSLAIDATTTASYRVQNQYGYNNVVIYQGQVSVEQANCKNQICVHEAAISDVGQSIICLPHRVSVEIVGNKRQDVDDISH